MDILDAQNPLETVETILNAQEWQYERLSEDQILVEVSGQNGEYKLQLNWQEKMSALQITVQTDICYSSYQYTEAASIIAGINSKLWLGHFELSAEQLTPTFRYTCFMRGLSSFNGSDYLAEIIEVALCESENHHAELFNLLRSEDEKALHIYGEDHYNLAYLAAAGNA